MSVKMERGHEWEYPVISQGNHVNHGQSGKGQSGKMDSGQTMLGGWGPGGLA